LVLVAPSLHRSDLERACGRLAAVDQGPREIAKALPPTPARATREASDVVVVSSSRYRVDAPQFRAFVAQLETASP
jgi:hypothetical protein